MSWLTGEAPERVSPATTARMMANATTETKRSIRLLHRRGGCLADIRRRGLMVAPIDGEFALRLHDLRSALDGTAVLAAVRHAVAADRPRGEAIIKAGRAAVAEGDLKATASADFAFHDLVRQFAGNRLIATTAHMDWHRVRRALMLLATRPAGLAPFRDEDEQILRAVLTAIANSLSEWHGARGHLWRGSNTDRAA